MTLLPKRWQTLAVLARRARAHAQAADPAIQYRTLVRIGMLRLVSLFVMVVATGACVADRGLLGVHVEGVPTQAFEIAASIGGVVFFLSTMLSNTSWIDALPVAEAASDKTLLYLRPFELDMNSLLQLSIGAAAGLVLHLSSRGDAYQCLLSIPLLCIRVSDEQNLQYSFGAYGRLVTFRQPGRRLQPVGALRLSANDDWKRDVARRMLDARLVIIRPGRSESMRWEAIQALRTVPPERLVFYLRFRGRKAQRQSAYDSFRQQLQAFVPVDLPVRLPMATYLVVDRAWTPHFFSVSNRPTDLVRQALSGDFDRERLRPLFAVLGQDGLREPLSLRERLSNTSWASPLVSLIIGFVFAVVCAVGTTVYFLTLMLNP